jgi:hypothetical protein
MNFTERILKNVENVGRLVYLFHAQSSAAEQGNAMLARVPRHAPAERPQRKMAHQLHKNELTLMHRATPRRVPRSRCATATRCSNRDQENTRLSVTCSTLKRPVPINVGRLWCIAGYCGRTFVLRASTLMRVPLPIPPSATSHGADGHDRIRIVPCECDGRARCRQS